MEKEKQLFEKCQLIGEVLDGELHILEHCDPDKEEGFRVYHAKGYCFTIDKEYCCEPEDIESFGNTHADGYYYGFCSNYEGFNALSLDEAINMCNGILDRINAY